MLSHDSFERKTIKLWKKLFFTRLNLLVVNAHILHNRLSNKKMLLEIFYEKITEGLLASAGTEIQEQGQTSSPTGILVGTDHSVRSWIRIGTGGTCEYGKEPSGSIKCGEFLG
jgi:hypothetical protein